MDTKITEFLKIELCGLSNSVDEFNNLYNLDNHEELTDITDDFHEKVLSYMETNNVDNVELKRILQDWWDSKVCFDFDRTLFEEMYGRNTSMDEIMYDSLGDDYESGERFESLRYVTIKFINDFEELL